MMQLNAKGDIESFKSDEKLNQNKKMIDSVKEQVNTNKKNINSAKEQVNQHAKMFDSAKEQISKNKKMADSVKEQVSQDAKIFETVNEQVNRQKQINDFANDQLKHYKELIELLNQNYHKGLDYTLEQTPPNFLAAIDFLKDFLSKTQASSPKFDVGLRDIIKKYFDDNKIQENSLQTELLIQIQEIADRYKKVSEDARQQATLIASLTPSVNNSIIEQINNLRSLSEVKDFRNQFLSQKGYIESLFSSFRNYPPALKPLVGKEINEIKQSVTAEFNNIVVKIENETIINEDQIDLTMPAKSLPVSEPGHEHPLISTLNRMVSIFTNMGFDVAYGPEVEDDEHNFEKLNFAPDHPARDMQDTFFIKPTAGSSAGVPPALLRTHTSPVQVRLMESGKLPIRAVMPGRVYRNEEITSRSAACFFQLEGLVIDKGVTMADLKAVLLMFARQFFGADSQIRLRPSYFPFTEPSAEVDVSCYICGGKGCRVCKHSGWLEILGSGMVHPNVLKACGIDPEVYSGYAFGMGIDRTAMMNYGINDLRMFTENDYRFLRQF
jgi:phenylalanyl-tRNA synthetase alpha chain